MNLPERFRPVFLARTRREKVLAVAFLAVLAAIWCSSFLTRGRAWSVALGGAREEAKAQDLWIENRAAFEARYEEAIARLDQSALPSRSEVLALVDALVRKYAFTFRIEPPQTQRRDRLDFHTLSLSVDKGDYAKLQSFYDELAASLPTVNVEQITLAADRRNPALLDARLRLVAVEFNR